MMAFITPFIVLTFVVPRSYLSPLGVTPSSGTADFFLPGSGHEKPFFCSRGSCFLPLWGAPSMWNYFNNFCSFLQSVFCFSRTKTREWLRCTVDPMIHWTS
uniref:Putative secreted protein n=1 Tax=Anopheles triannulatus TaxID=58253 RepID=A0A2M4B4A7_9DIPT